MNNIFYLGIKGSVVALERKTGREIWRRKLKRNGFVLVTLDGDILIAHTHGEIFGLNQSTGEILWNNGLDGLGYGFVTMASENMNTRGAQSAIQLMIQQQQTAAASG